MPDKIIALTTGSSTSLVGMTNEQYALLLWLEDNKALGGCGAFLRVGRGWRNNPDRPRRILRNPPERAVFFCPHH